MYNTFVHKIYYYDISIKLIHDISLRYVMSDIEKYLTFRYEFINLNKKKLLFAYFYFIFHLVKLWFLPIDFLNLFIYICKILYSCQTLLEKIFLIETILKYFRIK